MAYDTILQLPPVAAINGTEYGWFVQAGVNIRVNTAQITALGSGLAIPWAVAVGGTGDASFTQYGIVYGNGSSPLGVTAGGTASQYLLGGSPPTWGTLGAGVVTALGDATNATGGIATWPVAVSGGIGGLGTGVATSLADATNATGGIATWPVAISTGVSGLGTGVASALTTNVGAAGAFVAYNGDLGTPSAGTLTNAVGLPISTGVSGLGTSVAAAAANSVNAASGLVQLTGSTKLPIAVLVAGGANTTFVASPTFPSNTSAFLMQGLAGSITPTRTGIILITISGTINAAVATTVNNGVIYQVSIGTGAAPGSNTALAGTQLGAVQTYTSPIAPTATADVNVPFALIAITTGLTIATAYWVDLAAKSITNPSQIGFAAVTVNAVEL